MGNSFLHHLIRQHLGTDAGQLGLPNDFLQALSAHLRQLDARTLELETQVRVLETRNRDLRTMMARIDNVFFTVDIKTNSVSWISPACQQLYGYSQSAFYASPSLWYNVILPEDRHIVDANFPLVGKGQRFTQEYRITTADNTVKWIESRIIPELDDNGQPVRIDGISTDITARKEAELRLRQSESRFRCLVENSHDGIAMMDAQRVLVYISPSVKNMMGYEPAELLGSTAAFHIHPDDRENTTAQVTELLQQPGGSMQVVYRVQHKNGSWRHLRSVVTNMLHDEAIRGLVFNFEDITETVAVQQALEFDRANNQALINSTSDLMWSVDRNIDLITANHAFSRQMECQTGHPLQRGHNLLKAGTYSPAERKKWKQRYQRALSGESFTIEDHNTRPVESWYAVSFHPIYENGIVIGASCFAHDITRQKQSMALIRKSEIVMAEAERMAHLGSWEMGVENGETLYWSQEVFRIFGLDPEKDKPSYKQFIDLVHPDDRGLIHQRMEALIRERQYFSEAFRIVRQDQTELWVRGSGDVLFHRKNGKVTRLVGTVQDITGQKQAEAALQRLTLDLQQRNRDLEQFAYIVSHNLRGPVANIKGLTHLIQNHALDKSAYNNCIKGLGTSAQRLDEVMVDLNTILQVRNGMPPKKERLRFASLVLSIEESLRMQIKSSKAQIDTNFRQAQSMRSVKGYLYSIFYNLLSNAIKYSRPGISPVITITGTRVDGKVKIVFKDNGSGIDLEKHGHELFGLYRRFHQGIEGRGMGLFMVKTQVEALGGTISVESKPGKGTEFTLLFDEKKR